MQRLFIPVLCASLLATLAACEPLLAVSADDAAGTASVHATPRCTHCGWIESKRELGPQAGQPDLPVVYEYTVRMADGSSSQFREKPSVPWRIGERLMLIAGEADRGRDRATAAGR